MSPRLGVSRVNSGYFAPTYGQIRDIFYPTIEEVAHDWGLAAKINEVEQGGAPVRWPQVPRHGDLPVDGEAGRHRGLQDRQGADRRARRHEDGQGRAGLAKDHCSPAPHRARPDQRRGRHDDARGFKFVYQQFVKQVRERPDLVALYGLVQTSTYENGKNLPEDYIPSLRASYPPQLIAAYLRGQFTNPDQR